MIKNTKQFSFIFSPKALLSVVPTVVPFRIQKFLVSLGSLVVTLVFGIYTTFEKQENYINFRVLLTRVKQFDCFLCKTTYSELLKELITYYINILSLFKLKLLKILVFDYIRQPPADLKFD